MIGLQKAMTAREYQNQLLIEQGKLDLALDIKEKFGIDEAVRLTGFSKEELENEKLNINRNILKRRIFRLIITNFLK